MLLTVTLTEKHPVGDPTAVDVEAYDSWVAHVFRCGSVMRSDAEGVTVGVDEDKRVTLLLPPSLPRGSYSVEIVLSKEGIGRRSFECPVFDIVETNDEADVTYDLIEGVRSADIDMQFQFVEVDAILGENAYEMWKKLPGNEDKTLQDFIDEVLDLNGITLRATTAAERAETAAYDAEHLPYIGSDNYVYEWDSEEDDYVKTDTYVKGDPGRDADMSMIYTKAQSDARFVQKASGKGLSTNDYTTAEKYKLSTLQNYDDSNIRWLIQNLQASLSNYYTKSQTYSRAQVDALIASMQGMEIVIAEYLPTASSSTLRKIFLIPSSSSTVRDTKDEYITIMENSVYRWERIGSTSVDLSGYLKTTDVATVALSGSYNDLVNLPSFKTINNQSIIGTGNIDIEGGDGAQADWNETDTTDPAYIKNKPTIPAAQIQSDWNQSSSSSADYIKNKPTIPDISGKADKATTLAGYGITDAKIVSGVITLGSDTITPLTSHQDISGKADKVSSATSGNFAALDGNGNLTDSGHKHSDYLTSHQDVSDKCDADDVRDIISAVIGDLSITAWDDITVS